MKHITIIGRFESLNQYIEACRRNKYMAAKMIEKDEKNIIAQLKEQKIPVLKTPVRIAYKFYEPNRRRDKDNIAGFFHKIFQDSLVKAGLLPDDGWNEISGYRDDFGLDKHAHIDIMIFEKIRD